MRREHLMPARKENKHRNRAINPEHRTSSPKLRLLSRKSTPKEGAQIRGLCIYSFVINIRYCTQIHWNTIQNPFVHIFVIINFGTPSSTSRPLISFSKNQNFQIQTTSSSKESWPPKTSPFRLRRRTPDLSPKYPTKLAPKRWFHGIKTRSMIETTTMVVVRQMATLSSKRQD